jgi:hypothetical protein
MKTISLFVGIFIMLSVIDGSPAAQTVTIKANYCGSAYGSGAGTSSFMVGDDRLDLEMEFRDRTSSACVLNSISSGLAMNST